MAFKSRFFRNLKYKWLITGHLDQERALKIFEAAQPPSANALSEDDILTHDQMLKLPPRSVHNLSEMNPTGAPGAEKQVINPNSAILAEF